jgi:hypothetical protein
MGTLASGYEITGFTMFTCPRSFEGEIGIIQTNAIKSWSLLEPRPEILLISDDPGVRERAGQLGCRHISGVECNEYGTPLVRDVFKKGQGCASNRLVFYCNSDIVLTQHIVGALDRIVRVFDKFLMIGQRHDLYRPEPLDFSTGWDMRLIKRARKRGNLHGPTGVDYFGFVAGMYGRIPAFGLGRRAWDSWLVWFVLKQRNIPVIDVTEAAYAIHIGKTMNKPMTPEIRRNRELAGNAGTWGRINFATWRLAPLHSYKGELFR